VPLYKEPLRAKVETVDVLQRDGTTHKLLKNASGFEPKGKEAQVPGYHRVAVVVSQYLPLPNGPVYHDQQMVKSLGVHGYIFTPPAASFGPDPTVHFIDGIK
jgi:hypothetical protein